MNRSELIELELEERGCDGLEYRKCKKKKNITVQRKFWEALKVRGRIGKRVIEDDGIVKRKE